MAVSRKGWDSFGRYLDQRMDTIVTCGENLHSEIGTLIPQHPYASRETN